MTNAIWIEEWLIRYHRLIHEATSADFTEDRIELDGTENIMSEDDVWPIVVEIVEKTIGITPSFDTWARKYLDGDHRLLPIEILLKKFDIMSHDSYPMHDTLYIALMFSLGGEHLFDAEWYASEFLARSEEKS